MIALEPGQGGHHLVHAITGWHFTVIPPDRLGSNPAVLVDRHAIAAGVDGVVVAQLTELPDHFGAGQGDVEASGQFNAAQAVSKSVML